MNPLKWIRWKYFLPLAIVLGAIVVFFVFFFDSLLERGIEKEGAKMNDAKVEVDGLKTKFFSGRITIDRLQVADPDAPMTNRLEAGKMAFQLEVGELIGKRAIINEATLSGLGFNTPRKTSGAIPKIFKEKKEGPPSAAEKLAEKYKDRFKLNIDGIKGDAKAKIEFDPKDLQITKQAAALEEKAKALPGEWEKRVDDLKVEERLKQAEADLKAIEKTPTKGTEAITAIPASFKKLGEVKNNLNQIKKDIQDAKTGIQAEAKGLRNDVAGLSQAKKQDIDDLMSRLNLDFASPDRLVEGIVGPLVLKRFQNILHYVQLARQHMPSKKAQESLPPKPRVSGMDIEFPTPAALPRFWLKQATLDGTFGMVAASGNMTDMTTNPPRVGKPFKLDLKGLHEGRAFTANAVLDHTKDINKDSVVLQAAGLDIKKLVPGTEGTGVMLADGMATVRMALNLIGEENIGGNVRLNITGIKLDASELAGGDKLKVSFVEKMVKAIEAMKVVTVDAQIFGTWNDPDLKISSNLGPVLSQVVKDSVGDVVKEQRAKLEAQLNGLLGEKQKELSEKLGGVDGKVNQELAGMEGDLSKKISQAAGINLSSGGDFLKKLPW